MAAIQTMKNWLYDHRIYWMWGPAALWMSVVLYGHRFKKDERWTSRIWTRTPYGKRRYAEKVAAYKARRDELKRRAEKE